MKITSREIKDKFLNFFKEKKHIVIKNSSIIPNNDPTLLFINSGMAAIKNYFTGEEIPPKSELCNVQSCIRTIDIDDVGDKHHLTSFHMLGNWSIRGAYFKEGAIKLAYEFLTEYLLIPKSKLYFSVFSGDEKLGLKFDEESKKQWLMLGVSESHIVTCGSDDNFWGPAAEVGPCGPCTEIFYDTGVGEKYVPGGAFDTKKRYIEIWNAGVFMMLNKNKDKSFSPLSFKSVDAGAGLERFAMVLQGHSSVYETDLLAPIKEFIEFSFETFFKYYDICYSKDDEFNRFIRILTDHLRTVSLILSAKISPSNEGRGYIPRKLIRKCLVIVKKIVDKNSVKKIFKSPNLVGVIEFILENFYDIYPDFLINKDFILDEFTKEVDKFKNVLNEGFEKLNFIKNEKRSNITGTEMFELVTTFGLPVEIIKDFAVQNDIYFDEQDFFKKNEEHKNISRGKTVVDKEADIVLDKIFEKICDIESEFIGYDLLSSESKIIKIFSQNGEELDKVNQGENVFIVFDKTPVYAKSGGQESDFAKAFNSDVDIEIENAIKKNVKDNKEIYINFCKINRGCAKLNDILNINIDVKKRLKISKAHSCAHILQSALKEIWGNEISQHGSKIEDEKIRFDFNYDNKILRQDICSIEKIVNKKINENIKCKTKIMSKQDSLKEGATALFNDKYGEIVRVVSFDDYSKELCGGTHVLNTAQIGVFVIVSCENIGKGIKRINAFVGMLAFEYLQEKCNILHEAADMIGSNINGFLDNFNKKINGNVKKENIKNINEKELIHVKDFFYYIECETMPQNQAILKLSSKLKAVILVICGNEVKQVSLACCFDAYDSNLILKSVLGKFCGKCGGTEKLASGGVKNISVKKIVDEISHEIETYKN